MDHITHKPAHDKLSEILGYAFKETGLFFQAFRHASYVNEHAELNLQDNERLEFLGDAVLDLAISDLLMRIFPEAEEGTLSKYRAMVVDEAALSQIAIDLCLGDYILLGRGEEQSRGKEKPSILSDTLEALLGALYLDAGFDRTMKIIHMIFSPLIKNVDSEEMVHDFKSLLQEYTQQTLKALPKYLHVEESGPPHEKVFKVLLTLDGEILSEGRGKSKKEAEQMAAKEALFCLKAV